MNNKDENFNLEIMPKMTKFSCTFCPNKTDKILSLTYERGEQAFFICDKCAKKLGGLLYKSANNKDTNDDGWIPRNVKKPDGVMKEYLVTLKNGAVTKAWYDEYSDIFKFANISDFVEEYDDNPVIAYKSLPYAYEDENETDT